MRKLRDLLFALRRHPWKTFVSAFAAFSVLYTLSEAFYFFWEKFPLDKHTIFWVIVVVSFCYGVSLVWKPSKITIKIPDTSSKIVVLFGDLFAQEGIVSFAVSEYFDTLLGQPVSEKSVHGVFISRYFSGGTATLDQQLDQQLLNVGNHVVANKTAGKNKSYPIGATAVVNTGQQKHILFALTKCDPVTCEADADVTMMWIALHHLWQRARSEAGGQSLNLPLVGNGLSKIGLPPRDLLNLIILSAITETKAKQISQTIRVVLHPNLYEELDLRGVKQHWEDR